MLLSFILLYLLIKLLVEVLDENIYSVEYTYVVSVRLLHTRERLLSLCLGRGQELVGR